MIVRLLMSIISYEVENQNYLLILAEEIAANKAAQNKTTIEVEIGKIRQRVKQKETESTLVLAANMMKLMPGLKSEELESLLQAIRAKNN